MMEAMLSEAERSHLDERGFVILEDAIPADQAEALRDRSMALARQERSASGEHVYLGEKAQRVWNLVDKGEVFEQVIQHPRVLGAMNYLLGPDCTLSSFTVNVIGPARRTACTSTTRWGRCRRPVRRSRCQQPGERGRSAPTTRRSRCVLGLRERPDALQDVLVQTSDGDNRH